ncbi:MAG: response regulator [Polaromonas sp.]|nr:response regulator [Polaromonas sp.]
MTKNLTQDVPVPDFLANGGEMGAWIRAHDWRSTPLGPLDAWPRTLKSTLATLLGCPQPLFIGWGPQLLSFFNDAYRPMLGARMLGATGRPFAELWSEAWPDLEPIVRKALAGQGSSHEKMPLTLTRNGYAEPTWWSFSYLPLRDDSGAVVGMYCITTEVTEQVRAEQLVAAEKKRQAFWTGLNSALRGATEPQFVMAVGAEKLGEYLNAGCVGFAEVDPSGEWLQIDKKCTTRPSSADPGSRRLDHFGPRLTAALQTGKVVAVSDTATDPLTAGRAHEAAYAAIGCRAFINAPLIKDGRLAAILFVITPGPRVWTACEHALVGEVAERTWAWLQRLQAEIALCETSSALDQRTTELLRIETALRQSQKLEALGQLTGGVAHDFNNLLAVITSSIELLRNDKLPAEQHGKYLNLIFDTVGRAVKLTGQLLAFARQQPLSPEVFDVDTHVQGVVDLVRPLLGTQMQIRYARCSNAGCFAEADISQFEAALVNLVINARDAMNATGVLTITVREVDTVPAGLGHGSRPGGFVAISVADTGCGIAPNKIQAIFEPFYTTKEVGKGTGLGLSQVFGFAKQSGGEVEVKSELGAGSVFTLYLPGAESLPAAKALALALGSGSVGNGLRLLVVEDNETLAEMTCEILNTLDYHTTWAASGAAALELLARDSTKFDLVFSDVIMPGVNGVELAEAVRARYPALAMVLASGYSAVVNEEGTHGFELIAKPYTSDTLVRAFRSAMARQNA